MASDWCACLLGLLGLTVTCLDFGVLSPTMSRMFCWAREDFQICALEQRKAKPCSSDQLHLIRPLKFIQVARYSATAPWSFALAGTEAPTPAARLFEIDVTGGFRL
jgi:hypothetical protein